MNELPRSITIVGSGMGRSMLAALAKAQELGVEVVEVDSVPQKDREYKLRVMRELTCQPEAAEDRKAHKAAMKKANKKKPARGGGRP